MQLKLSIIKYKHEPVEKVYENEFFFDLNGGSIGRSQDNTWVLSRDQYISRKHALISYQNQMFYLQDISQHGCFLNNLNKPLEKSVLYPLKNDDIIHMGAYDLSVTIIGLETSSEPQEPEFHEPLQLNLSVISLDGKSGGSNEKYTFNTQGGCIGRNTECDWQLLYKTKTISRTHAWISSKNGEYYLKDVSGNGCYIDGLRTDINKLHKLKAGSVLRIGKYEIDIQISLTKEKTREYEKPLGKYYDENKRLLSSPEGTPLKYLLDGANIKLKDIADIQLSISDDIYKLIGRTLSETLQGNIKILRSLKKIKNKLHIEDVNDGKNPLKYPETNAKNVIIQGILDKSKRSYFHPLPTVVLEASHEIQTHQLAFMESLPEASYAVIKESFSPKELERKLKNQRPVFGKYKSLWKLLESTHNDIKEGASESFQNKLLKKFATIYKSNIK